MRLRRQHPSADERQSAGVRDELHATVDRLVDDWPGIHQLAALAEVRIEDVGRGGSGMSGVAELLAVALDVPELGEHAEVDPQRPGCVWVYLADGSILRLDATTVANGAMPSESPSREVMWTAAS